MATKVVPDGDESAFVEGVDRHYYRRQVGPSSPFDNTHAFRLAAAIAKDKARHKLIKAVRKEEQRIKSERGVFQEFSDRANNPGGDADYSKQARRNVLANRTVDGVKGASDDAIKL